MIYLPLSFHLNVFGHLRQDKRIRLDYSLEIKCHVSFDTANPVASLLADESELVLLLTVNQPGLNATRQQIWGRKAEDTCIYCPQVANSGTSPTGVWVLRLMSIICILYSFHKDGNYIQLWKAGRVTQVAFGIIKLVTTWVTWTPQEPV